MLNDHELEGLRKTEFARVANDRHVKHAHGAHVHHKTVTLEFKRGGIRRKAVEGMCFINGTCHKLDHAFLWQTFSVFIAAGKQK